MVGGWGKKFCKKRGEAEKSCGTLIGKWRGKRRAGTANTGKRCGWRGIREIYWKVRKKEETGNREDFKCTETEYGGTIVRR